MSTKKADVLLTVFTPAYNRAHTITRTYESLCRQSCKDFVWLVVDDGSTDNTAELVKEWQSRDNGFEIRYIYKKNGGMHSAHNTAYRNIDTELNTCVDSDDMMPDDGVEKIVKFWKTHGSEKYAGMLALDSDMNGGIIGKGFPENLVETTLTGYYKNGGQGDKKLIYRTEIMNKYPEYPEFEGERYVGLSYKYILCDQEYKLLVLNEVVCNVDYQNDGSTATMWKQYYKNPKGFAFLRKICMQYPDSNKKLFVDCIHYVSSSIIAGNSNFIKESPQKALTVLAVPFGALLSLYTKFKARPKS